MNHRAPTAFFAVAAVGIALQASAFAGASVPQEPSRQADDSPWCGIQWKIVSPVLVTKPAAGLARISWPPPTITYRNDVLRGSLTVLAATQGDFSAATETCLQDDVDATVYDDPEVPPAGGGYWYLVREDVWNGCPGWGSGTYNSAYAGQGHQVDPRDAEILASGRECSCFAWCCASYGYCN